MLRPNQKIISIGSEDVVAVVIRYTVGPLDLTKQSPGDIVEVKIGESVLPVFASICRPEIDVDRIPRDGATMPSGEIDDVVNSVN